MTPAQVAKIVGCHSWTIRQRIRDGSLRASRSPVRKNRWKIHRESLIRWLLDAGWSHDEIRRVCPLTGPLLTVGLRPGLRGKWIGEDRLDYPGMFVAGTMIASAKPWGILFDLGSLGAATTAEELCTYRSQVDRPVLIALHADDFVNRGVFDACISDSLPVGKLAQRIRALRPWS